MSCTSCGRSCGDWKYCSPCVFSGKAATHAAHELEGLTKKLEGKILWMRDRFADIAEDAKVLREHARRAPDLDMMVLGIIAVAENEVAALNEERTSESNGIGHSKENGT